MGRKLTYICPSYSFRLLLTYG